MNAATTTDMTLQRAKRVAQAWATEAKAPAYVVRAAGRLHPVVNLEQIIRAYGDQFEDVVWSTR